MTKVLKMHYDFEKGAPIMLANASAKTNPTGTWRIWKPVIDESRCISCKTCFTYCPHGAISWVDNKPKIDYTFCKGCLICVENCPIKCIEKEAEAK